jgi:N,N'-diacetyllegionaminate synthase
MSVLIVAEIGINHNGSESTAKWLIDAAIEAGADVAKFQLFKPELQGEHLRSVAFSREQILRMESYCTSMGIKFACTAFDADSLKWLLANTKMAFVKIGSGQARDKDIIYAAIRSQKPIIQSVKAGEMGKYRGNPDWSHLHVVDKYPTPSMMANLNRMVQLEYNGLSDHSGDIFMPLAAVALGAKIIECHITLDKNQEGYDHKSSLTPGQFKKMVRGIRAIEKGLQ